MTTHNREVWIDASKEKVWAALADFGNVYLFNPTVPQSHLTSEQETGVGTSRHCEMTIEGASIEERIVDWNEGDSMKIEIYEGTKAPPFRTAVATISLTEKEGGTLVTGSLEYQLKYGPIGSLMDKAMVSSQFGKAMSGMFAGLKDYIESGEQVDSFKGLNIEPVAVLA